jgi:hypothetical protein
VIDAYETLKTKGAKKIDPFKILKTMSSTASANLTSNQIFHFLVVLTFSYND